MAQRTGYGITDFYNTITQRGLARNNVFRIKSIGDIFAGDSDDLLLYAQGGSIPARQISSSKVSFRTFDFQVPMTASYPENSSYSLTFYCDDKYVLRDILENWSREVFDEHKNVSVKPGLVDIELVLIENSFLNTAALPTQQPVPPVNPKANGTPKERRKYILKGCFPQSIGATSYNVGSNGEFATVPVNIAFQYVISEKDPNGN